MGKVISFHKHRSKKDLVYNDRQPLYISHGIISSEEDFGSRVDNMRAALLELELLFKQLKEQQEDEV